MDFLNSYFQLGPIPIDAMGGYYDWGLVLLSYLVSSLASYVALDVTERIRATENSSTQMWWLICGAFAMGCGIWTMHFIGMLAFVMPMQMDYDAGLTALSLVIGVVASGFAFFLIKNDPIQRYRLVGGGILLGFAIVSMHYTGMWAMEGVEIRYLPGLFIASVVIAIITSETALGLMILGSKKIYPQGPLKIGSALLMGFAICGMHYTGMEAAVFTHVHYSIPSSSLLHPDALSFYIATTTVVIMVIALGASKYSIMMIQRRNQKLLETEAILEQKSQELQDLNLSLTHLVDDLSSKEERIRAILSAAADGIIVMNEQGIIEICNRAAEGIFGHRVEEMINCNITEFIGVGDDDDPEKIHSVPFASILRQNDAVVEYVAKTKHERVFPLELSVSRSNFNGKVFYIIVFRDIQDRKRSERKVATLNQQLVTAARLAGMAEVATCVLHNVGNVLNSINVTAKVLLDRDSSSKIAGLKRLSDIIVMNKDHLETFLKEDPIGRALPEYLKQLADYWTNEWTFMRSELTSLNEKVHHIKNVVAMQQSVSGGSSIKEKVQITKLIEDALAIHSENFEKYGVIVERDFSPVPPIELDKVKTVQILINLVKNAFEAVVERNGPEKKISVRLEATDAGFVNVEITDSGRGIQSEDITKIFSYGFTTKKSGHGFGLHSSALSAQEAGGSLRAFSPGINKGATFVLSLPLQAQEVTSEV
ncbi:MAG: MHYT domain-containing protein [Chlamydiales bacterium]|nr:MHYT domain-containing protein [Chlamydiales bacterium]